MGNSDGLYREWKQHTQIDYLVSHQTTYKRLAISQFLASNPPLEELHLQNNKFNNEDASAIAQHVNLKLLHLHCNPITPIGSRILHKAVFDKTSSASGSNHDSCTIFFLFPGHQRAL